MAEPRPVAIELHTKCRKTSPRQIFILQTYLLSNNKPVLTMWYEKLLITKSVGVEYNFFDIRHN